MHNSKIYVQVVGIAQGGCLSSMLADLFLYYYEGSYTNNSFMITEVIFRLMLNLLLISVFVYIFLSIEIFYLTIYFV